MGAGSGFHFDRSSQENVQPPAQYSAQDAYRETERVREKQHYYERLALKKRAEEAEIEKEMNEALQKVYASVLKNGVQQQQLFVKHCDSALSRENVKEGVLSTLSTLRFNVYEHEYAGDTMWGVEAPCFTVSWDLSKSSSGIKSGNADKGSTVSNMSK
jgi:hypothetical protein